MKSIKEREARVGPLSGRFRNQLATPTRGRTIGEGDVSLFAGLVGDYNPLHVDEEFSKAEHLRRPRRARAAGAFDRDRPDVAAELDRRNGARPARELPWEFQAPVKLGDTVSAKVTPLEARPSKTPGRGILKIGFEVLEPERRCRAGRIDRAVDAAPPGLITR